LFVFLFFFHDGQASQQRFFYDMHRSRIAELTLLNLAKNASFSPKLI
jgi:hypothetical protein